MITFLDAVKIAYANKNKHKTASKLNIARDCGDYWHISYFFIKPNGEKMQVYGLKMAYDISKKDGNILNIPPARPGSEESKRLKTCKIIEIPEEYRS